MEYEGGDVIFIVSTVLIAFITIALLVLVTVFHQKKRTLIVAQERAKKQFEKAIAETQIEIREETLRNISWELHDNIGQLLTLAKIQLQNATLDDITEVKNTITKGLNEVRALSKLINPDAIKNIKLRDALQLEVDRFNRLNFINASLLLKGIEKRLDQKANIIIFRMLQEFFSNTIKHSKAANLTIELNYTDTTLQITAKDDGIGFKVVPDAINGIGLTNIKSRAHLIGAIANLTSEKNKGTQLTITYTL